MPIRIGLQICEDDYFWIQVREAIYRRASELDVELVSLFPGNFLPQTAASSPHWIDELRALRLNGLITMYVSEAARDHLSVTDFPIVSLTETPVRAPFLISPRGFFAIAYQLGSYIGSRLPATHGTVLLIGGGLDDGEAGQTRLAGLRAGLASNSSVTIRHLPSIWGYEDAYALCDSISFHAEEALLAIIGLTDALAQGAWDGLQHTGLIRPTTLLAGINGDPMALEAIQHGRMSATMALNMHEFGRTALELIVQAATNIAHPDCYPYQAELITPTTRPSQALTRPFLAPHRPSGHFSFTHQSNSYPLTQLEASLAITHRIGTILDRAQLTAEVADIIREKYGYDQMQLFRWDEQQQALVREIPEAMGNTQPSIALKDLGIFGQVLQRASPLYLANAHNSQHPLAMPDWPGTHTRFIVPVRVGGSIYGLLDLHSQQARPAPWFYRIELQALADQLGVAIHNAQLYQEALLAQSKAERLDRLKTRLLATVSHELRTPLQIILGYSQSARALADTDSPLYGIVAQIEHNSQHLTHVLDDLLDLARAEIGELKLAPMLFQPAELLGEVLQSVAETSKQEAICWSLDLPAILPTVRADTMRLRQILLNLLLNAREHTEAGEITLGAGVEEENIHFWVRDSGVGIPLALQARIFEPFFTYAHGEQRVQGIGLGLAITHHLVHLHGGTLVLESQPGQGSTFHVYLPLPSPAALTASVPSTPERSIQQQEDGLLHIGLKPLPQAELQDALKSVQVSTSARRMLLVEDNPSLRQLYCQTIHATFPDCLILEAEDGAMALSLLEQETPDLVMLDLVLPDIDGFTVLEWLRTHDRTRHIPVLVMSGYTFSADDMQRLNFAQVTVHLKDVLTPDELPDALQRSLSSKRGLSQPTSLLVKQALHYLQQHYTRALSLQELADEVGSSRDYLGRIFHRELGLSPWEYLNRYRLLRAQHLLRNTDQSIKNIALHVGFQDVSYFSRLFRQHLGVSPRTYRLTR